MAGPDGNRAVIVLDACQVGRLGFKLTGIDGFAQAFLKRGAGAFVGTLWPVVDHLARTFGVLPELWTGAMLGFPQSEENRGEEESL